MLFEANLIGLLCNEFLPVPPRRSPPLRATNTLQIYYTKSRFLYLFTGVNTLLDLLFLEVFYWPLLAQYYLFWSSCLTDSRLVAALTRGLTFNPLHAFPPSLWSFYFCLQESRSFFLDGQHTGEFDVLFWAFPLYFSMLLWEALEVGTYFRIARFSEQRYTHVPNITQDILNSKIFIVYLKFKFKWASCIFFWQSWKLESLWYIFHLLCSHFLPVFFHSHLYGGRGYPQGLPWCLHTVGAQMLKGKR